MFKGKQYVLEHFIMNWLKKFNYFNQQYQIVSIVLLCVNLKFWLIVSAQLSLATTTAGNDNFFNMTPECIISFEIFFSGAFYV